MDIPASMKDELGAWNNGAGIDLESWIGTEGTFAHAVAYATLFWPKFTVIDGYILRVEASRENVRAFARADGATRESVEWVMNHLHVCDLFVSDDGTPDKLFALGLVLKEMWEAKLKWQFPDTSFEVELYVPPDQTDELQYQLSFWQAGGGEIPALDALRL